jgi:hypothetical protein
MADRRCTTGTGGTGAASRRWLLREDDPVPTVPQKPAKMRAKKTDLIGRFPQVGDK